MAASPNPLQGSLFKSDPSPSSVDANETNSSNLLNERLANKELKDDAQLRPRSKNTKHQIKEEWMAIIQVLPSWC